MEEIDKTSQPKSKFLPSADAMTEADIEVEIDVLDSTE